jgi:hypothetical protein
MITILEFTIIAVITILAYAFIKTVVDTIKSK